MKIADNPSIALGMSNIPHTLQSSTVDAKSLESELRALIHGEVRFDAGSRALYMQPIPHMLGAGVMLVRGISARLWKN